MVSATGCEKPTQQRRAVISQHTAEHINAVVEALQTKHIRKAACGTGLGIEGTEHHAPHTRMNDGCRTHDARL